MAAEPLAFAEKRTPPVNVRSVTVIADAECNIVAHTAAQMPNLARFAKFVFWLSGQKFCVFLIGMSFLNFNVGLLPVGNCAGSD